MIKHTLIRNTALALLGFAAMGLGSCKKEVTQRVDQAFSAIYEVKPSDWKTDGPSYLYQDFPVPELDDFLAQNGAVLVYISLDNKTSYEALPQVVNNVAYGAFHTSGQVGVDLQPADGGNGEITVPTGSIFVKIVLVDATPLD